REMDGLLGQVYDCNWLALPTVKPTNKDSGSCKLLFFYRIAHNLLKGVLLGGWRAIVGVRTMEEMYMKAIYDAWRRI
ncbi:hypothetical protein Tco_0718949, partial [Tanacetum coccineum]